jgi:hypothetical protein
MGVSARKVAGHGPKLERWIQWIDATKDGIRVREEDIVATGQCANVSLEAKFDGSDYAVTGSSLCDKIAYTRPESRKILGTGKKNDSVTLREMIVASDDGQALTLTFAIFANEREVMSGVAVFQRGTS